MKTQSVLTFQGTFLLAKSCSMFPATPNTMDALWWNPEPTMANKTFSNPAVWCNTIKYGWAWTRSSRVHDRTNRRVSSDVSCKHTGLYSAHTDITSTQCFIVTSLSSIWTMYSTLCKSNSPRWSNIYPRSMKAQRYSFTLPLISVLDGGQQSTCSSLQETDPSTLSTGGWVGPRSRMHRYQKSRTHYNSPPDYTACSKSLYQLCYPSPQV